MEFFSLQFYRKIFPDAAPAVGARYLPPLWVH